MLPGMREPEKQQTQDTPEQAAKRRAEQKLWEQHAAEVYLKGIYPKDKDEDAFVKALTAWRAVGEKDLPDLDGNDAPHDPKAVVDVDVENITAQIFLKDGLYENAQTHIKITVQRGKIYPKDGANIHEAYKFALEAQGGLATGVTYDVGQLGDLNHRLTTLAFKQYKQRLQSIETLQNAALENRTPLSFSENTTTFLKTLLLHGDLSEADYNKILQKQRLISIAAKEKESNFLIEPNRGVKAEIDKIQDGKAITDKADQFTISDKNAADKVGNNIQKALDHVTLELDLLEKTAKQANRLITELDEQVDRQEKLHQSGLSGNTDDNKSDNKSAIQLAEQIKKSSDWVQDRNLKELIGDSEKEGEAQKKLAALTARINKLKEVIEGQMTPLKAATEELERLNKIKNVETKKVDALENVANELKTKIEKHNETVTDPTKTIDINTTDITKLQAAGITKDDKGKDDPKYTDAALTALKQMELKSTNPAHVETHKAALKTAEDNVKNYKDGPAKIKLEQYNKLAEQLEKVKNFQEKPAANGKTSNDMTARIKKIEEDFKAAADNRKNLENRLDPIHERLDKEKKSAITMTATGK